MNRTQQHFRHVPSRFRKRASDVFGTENGTDTHLLVRPVEPADAEVHDAGAQLAAVAHKRGRASHGTAHHKFGDEYGAVGCGVARADADRTKRAAKTRGKARRRKNARPMVSVVEQSRRPPMGAFGWIRMTHPIFPLRNETLAVAAVMTWHGVPFLETSVTSEKPRDALLFSSV